MYGVNGHLAVLLIAGLACAATGAHAEPSDIKDLAKNPQDFLGQDVEMRGVCVKGGRAGDVLGYECTTKDGVYVAADDIEPEDAKEKLAECADTACEMTVEFVPHSYTSSGVIEPDKTVIIYNTKTAKVSD